MPQIIDRQQNGHHVVEGMWNGQPMLTLQNEQLYNKMKNTGGVPKMKVFIETFTAIVEFVQKHDPNYKLPAEIVLEETNGQKTIKIVKKAS